jgi:hypothetical protein
MTPGQRRAQRALSRLEQFRFYVICLTNVERSKLATRYLRKVPSEYRACLIRTLTIPEPGLCEVLSVETYGW